MEALICSFVCLLKLIQYLISGENLQLAALPRGPAKAVHGSPVREVVWPCCQASLLRQIVLVVVGLPPLDGDAVLDPTRVSQHLPFTVQCLFLLPPRCRAPANAPEIPLNTH